MPPPTPLPRRHDRVDAGRRRALVGAVLAIAVGRVDAAADFDLGRLTALLSQVRSGEATFTEKRTVKELDKTLEFSGRLSFEAPDTFVRETLPPRQEKVAVVGNRVTMSQGGRSRTIALDSVREASLIIEAIRGTLTGNRDALDRNFVTTVTGDARRWTLELVPREAYLREQVASVKIAGEQSLVREVQVAMFDGDTSVMTITPTVIAAPPGPSR